MTARRFAIVWAVAAGIAATTALSAHRLDEYLQATRVAISESRIDLEMDLTPGASVANDVFASIDTDTSGAISADEARAYASRVVASSVIEMDGRHLSAVLVDCRAPQLAEMREGIGVIQLTARADMEPLARGAHRLRFVNTHRQDIGVYLVNALVPSTDRVAIVGQARDPRQREFTLDFRVGGASRALASVLPKAAIVVVLALPAALMWRRRRT